MPAFATRTSPQRVREEIAAIEARLTEIGHDGDCAYERAMVRFFEQQVAMRRAWLEPDTSMVGEPHRYGMPNDRK